MKPETLYLSYTGLLAPLGRSQVLAYLSRLSRTYSITLVTFEKRADFENKDEVKKLQDICESFGINWQPRIYHNKPRLLATAWDLLMLSWDTLRISSRKNVKLVHCRSYIPTIAAWLVGKVTRTPFVFDMRALWPEEMIDAGRLERKSVIYVIINHIERKLLNDSSAVVSLTSAAIPYLMNKYPELHRDKFTVIPTCVDLSRFHKLDKPSNQKLVIGTMGTVVSGWYHLDWMINTLKQSQRVFTQPSFKIITKDDPDIIRNLSESLNFENNKLLIKSSTPDAIQSNIQDLLFAILYFTSGVSKIGSAPTRMAEFLACGIPILGNRGVGDMADIIEQHNIGIVIEDGTEESIELGLEKMKILLQDPELAERCRQTVIKMFSANMGAQKYDQIYQKLV